MKTAINCCLIAGTLLFLSFPCKATHIWGADISWKQITKDSYVVSVNIYRDCNGVALSSKQQITVSNSSIDKTYNLSLLKVVEITPVCKKQCTRCSSAGCSFGYGFQKYTMTSGFRLDTGFCEYNISWQDTNRSGLITTGANDEGIYITAYLNRCHGFDNSPVLINKPLLFIGQRQCLTYNPTALDTDKTAGRDSLSYHLIKPRQTKNLYTSFIGKYAYNKPFTFDSFPNPGASWNPPDCAGFHFDSLTGELEFSPQKIETGIIAFAVDEWRKDKTGKYIKIGEIQRDLATAILKYPNNHAPVLSGINGTIATRIDFCTGSMNCFTINSNDVDVKDTVTYDFDSTAFPKGATFSVEHKKQHPRFTLCWKPDTSYISTMPLKFVIGCQDNACPIPAKTSRTFNFYIYPALRDTITIAKNCQEVTFKARPKTGITIATYKWTGDDGLSDSLPTFIHHYSKAGTYKYKLLADNGHGCTKTDSGVITVLPDPSAPSITSGVADSLFASGKGVKYIWIRDTIVLKDTANYVYPALIGNYTVQLIDSNGCVSPISNPFSYTGIKASLCNSELHIYPNPTSGSIIIEAPGIKDGKISITSLTGQIQFQSRINEMTSCDLHALPKGVYLLKLEFKNGLIMQKVILQ